jgi:hypothetical protein
MDQCDFIIDNNEKELIIPQALQLHEKFMKMADDKSRNN